jgi:ubiquinone/menaquinone biosynthesis C-methylase UbiE
MHNALPKYAARLDALHRALTDDFRNIVNHLPLKNQGTVVDVGCGDGFFTALLAENHAGVIGLDNSDPYLDYARETHGDRQNVKFVKGDVRRLPFGDASVDIVWSAHSMHSYPDVRYCLAEFHRVLRPGGLLAVLESDNVHSVMLSWPPDLELTVREAEHQEIGDEDSYIGTYFPRFAVRFLEETGFEGLTRHHFLINRFAPVSDDLKQFVELYLENLAERTGDQLTEKMRSRLALLADPSSDKFLPNQKSFHFGSLQVLSLGYVPNP